MRVKIFKERLEKNGVDLFDFCIRNGINPISITKLNLEDVVSEEIEDKLNNYIEKIKALEVDFLDRALSQGLKVEDERVQINLDGKQDFNLKLDSSLLSKVDFYTKAV